MDQARGHDPDDRSARLAAILGRGRAVIVGVGNRGRGDDSFGPAVVAKLRGRVPAVLIDAGPCPENITSTIAQQHPETVLWVDAGQIGQPPGEWVLCEPDELAGGGLSVHAGSVALVAQYVAARTGARSYCLLAQPLRLGAPTAGEPNPAASDSEVGGGVCPADLSAVMARTVRDVSRLITDTFGQITQQKGTDASCLPEVNS